MCRPCLYTAHVYRDDVTFDLGRYYIYETIMYDFMLILIIEDVYINWCSLTTVNCDDMQMSG
jgi:hypothetical protein